MTQKKAESTIVYQDERFTLGQANGTPFLTADGKTYTLSCHPYEPCLYITDADGRMTVVRSAFDPYFVIGAVSRGQCFTSVTGRRYDAQAFCTAVAYAAGKGTITIDEAEKIFPDPPRENPVNKAEKAELPLPPAQPPEGCAVVTDDPFFAAAADYPDSAVEWCLVRDSLPHRGISSHRRALSAMCCALLYDPEEDGWRCDADKAQPTPITADELFTRDSRTDRLTYRRAFLAPPCGAVYRDGDFERINAALFPDGTGELEIFEWTTDWSDYFDDGHEWWGALCLTVYDKALDRYVVLTASATD